MPGNNYGGRIKKCMFLRDDSKKIRDPPPAIESAALPDVRRRSSHSINTIPTPYLTNTIDENTSDENISDENNSEKRA